MIAHALSVVMTSFNLWITVAICVGFTLLFIFAAGLVLMGVGSKGDDRAKAIVLYTAQLMRVLIATLPILIGAFGSVQAKTHTQSIAAVGLIVVAVLWLAKVPKITPKQG